MRYYVTLFDSNYLTRGLVMYRSLLNSSETFHLWIVCFDSLAYQLLLQLNLEQVTLISLAEFEDAQLLAIKPQRTQQEYCWSCTPSVALYVINQYPEVDAITYIDADLMFFSSTEPIFTEIGDASILLTEHRYVPEFDLSQTSGIYNVQFMYFRRNEEGLKALHWWRDRCLEWCFARIEENKYGDQKYLDDWPERFKDVHILQHCGAGVAPWNAACHTLEKIGEQIYVDGKPLIFYHFQGLTFYHWQISCLYHQFPINSQIKEFIYRPYLQSIQQAYRDIRQIDPKFQNGILPFPKFSKRPKNLIHFWKWVLHEINEGRYCLYA